MLTAIMLIVVAQHMKVLNEINRSKTIIVQALIPFSKSNQPHNMFKNVFIQYSFIKFICIVGSLLFQLILQCNWPVSLSHLHPSLTF